MQNFTMNTDAKTKADEILAEAWKADKPEIEDEELKKQAEENEVIARLEKGHGVTL